jgi:hypothetical protein
VLASQARAPGIHAVQGGPEGGDASASCGPPCPLTAVLTSGRCSAARQGLELSTALAVLTSGRTHAARLRSGMSKPGRLLSPDR